MSIHNLEIVGACRLYDIIYSLLIQHTHIMSNFSDIDQKRMVQFSEYSSQKLQEWLLHTTIGREILHKERLFFTQNVADVFGKYSLQIGLSDINLLHGNKIKYHYTINSDLQTDLHFLPFANDSIDLIVCPHILEFSNHYHHILQELYRVLSPNGKIILTCFNKYSWFGLLQTRIPILKNARLISLKKIKIQATDLEFRIIRGKFFSYSPPLNRASTLKRISWINKVGDRWFPTLANSFALILCKDKLIINRIKSKQLDLFKNLNPQLGTASVCNKI